MKLKKLIKYIDENHLIKIIKNGITCTDYIKFIENEDLESKILKIEYDNEVLIVTLENKDYNKLFDDLVKFLKEKNYEIEIKQYDIYRFANISGQGIKGGFASKHDELDLNAEYYHNNIITIDNEKCYNKPRTCPLHLYLPKNEEELNILLEKLKYWGSYDGYVNSNLYKQDEDSLDL